MSPRRIVLATAGSLGDLHPFIALALALKARGFEAEIASAPDYAEKVRAEGLAFHAIGPSQAELEARMGMTSVEMIRAVARSNTFLFEKLLLPNLESGTRQMAEIVAGAAAVVGSTFATGAAMAAEMNAVPFVPVALQPAIVFSAYDPPRLPAAPWLAPARGGLQLAANRLLVATARLATQRWARPVDRIRVGLGLPVQGRNLLLDGLSGYPLALGLYSPLLGPRQPDAPAGFQVVGPAMYDSDVGGDPALPAPLATFLAAGPPPLVFTLGSAAVHDPGDFYVQSLQAARALGRRAVLLVGPGGDVTVAAGSDAIAVPYAPFSQLFSHAEAIIHQGGIGTTQQALQAGRPQLIVPVLGDQPDNAARIVRLGCGAMLARSRYRSDRVATVLTRLLVDPEIRATAARLGVVAAQEDGAAVAAERIAELLSVSS